MKARLLFFFCFAILFVQTGECQYTLNSDRSSAFIGVGGAMGTTGFLFLNDFPPLSDEQIQSLATGEHQFTFKFDRWATLQSSRVAKTTSDVLLTSSFIPPVVLLFRRPKANDDRRTHSFMFFESAFLTWGLTNVTKRIARRPRPYMYHDDFISFPIEERRTKNSRQSFFSGHTSLTAANYFFTARTFSEYYPNNQWRPWIWGASISIPALTGFLRVKAGKHFPTDVIVGYAVGALIGGVLVPALH